MRENLEAHQGNINCGASSQADFNLNYFLSKFVDFPKIASIFIKFPLTFSISSQPGWQAGTIKAWIIICICKRDTLFPWSLTFQATLLFGISILLYVGFREILSTLEVNKKSLSDYVHTSMLTIIWEGKMSRRSWKSDGVFKLCRKLLYILPLCVAAVWSECKLEVAELFHTNCGEKFFSSFIK